MNAIDMEALTPYSEGIYKVHTSDVCHNLVINRKDSDFLFVFFQGAVDKRKPQPNFQRISWKDHIPGNLIIFADPTIDETTLTIGWSQHSPKVNYFYRMAELIKLYSTKIAVPENKIYLYGSSAGGFSALMVAAYFKHASVIVNNPQTDWTKFYRNKVEEVLSIIYNGLSIEEYKEKFSNRFSTSRVYENVGRVPKIFYMQNINDDFHYKNHYLPFIDEVTKMSGEISTIHSILYSSEIEKHNPRDMKATLEVINMVKSI